MVYQIPYSTYQNRRNYGNESCNDPDGHGIGKSGAQFCARGAAGETDGALKSGCHYIAGDVERGIFPEGKS